MLKDYRVSKNGTVVVDTVETDRPVSVAYPPGSVVPADDERLVLITNAVWTPQVLADYAAELKTHAELYNPPSEPE